MKSIEKTAPREVTIGKLRRDAENIRKYARFVIVLDVDSLRVIDNGILRARGLPYARLIAVLGSVHHKDSFLDRSVLMEIGYSRTHPYRQIEQSSKDEDGNRSANRWFIKQRARIGNLSNEDFSRIYPHILNCMAIIVLECREGWRNKDAWWVDGPGYIERGIYFTVHQSDVLIHRQMCLEDIHYCNERYISNHARLIHWWLRGYKYSYYPVRQLKSYAGAQKVAELISGYGDSFYVRVLLEHFKTNSRLHGLLQNIMEVFEIVLAPLTSTRKEALCDSVVAFPLMRNTHCYYRPDNIRRNTQMTVFEITLERRYREKNEIPF